MVLRFAYCILFFHILLLMSGHAEGIREVPNKEHFHKNLKDVIGDRSLKLYHKILNELFKRPTGPFPPAPPAPPGLPGKGVEFEVFVFDYIEPSYIGLITTNDVYFGKVMPIYFPIRDHPSNLSFAISEEMVGSSFTYTLSELTNIFKPLSIPENYPLKNKPDYDKCEIDPDEADETKVCVRDVESISKFILGVFGSEGSFRIVETKQAETSIASVQEYMVLEDPEEIQGPRKVFCHPMSDAFYCHSSVHAKVLKVSLGTENGDKMETVAVCHTNPSGQNSDDSIHGSFRSVKPEKTAIPCHFLPVGHFVWVQSPTPVKSS